MRMMCQYSFIQFQAKCHQFAPYEYYSWGGSPCEDFLELAIGFALLSSFGIVAPIMSVIALVSHIVEYRLLAYRMTNITCRPMPLGAEGIGTWQHVFEAISMVAVAINVGLAVFVMHPMRKWPSAHQFAAFIILEHAMLLLQGACRSAIPSEPEDVQRIEDFNAIFKRKYVKHRQISVPEHEKHSMDNVRIGLGMNWL